MPGPAQAVLDRARWRGPRSGRASSRRPRSAGTSAARWRARARSGAAATWSGQRPTDLVGQPVAQHDRHEVEQAGGAARPAGQRAHGDEAVGRPQLLEQRLHAAGRLLLSSALVGPAQLAAERRPGRRSWRTRNAARSGDSTTRSRSKVVALSQPLSLPCW